MLKLWTTRICAAATLAFVPAWSAGLAQAPATGADSYVWDLESEYPTQQDWDRDVARVRAAIERLRTLRGVAGRSARDLADVLDAMRAARGLAAHMSRFGFLTAQVDTSSDIARARYDAGAAFEAQAESAAAPLEADIRAIGRARTDGWATAEPRLRGFAHNRRLQRIFHETDHSAGPDAQSLVGLLERWPRTTGDTYDALIGEAIAWPSLATGAGDASPLTPGSYRSLRRSGDRAARETVARTFHAAVERYEATFGLLFTRRVEADLTIAQARGFADSTSAALNLNDGLPAAAVEQSFATARSSRAVAARYAALIARAFQAPRARYADVLARSPWRATTRYTVPQAIELILDSVSEFGPDYQRAMRALFARPWFHLPPGPNKSGEFGVFIPAGGGHPYALMTYTGDLGSVRTLASAAQALQMDSEIPADGAPDRRTDDQPVFGNARWFLGQFLLDDALIENAADHEQRAALLFDHLNRLWGEFFYRGAMAELDQWVMTGVMNGTPPTGAQISARYLELMRDYGGVEVDDLYGREWVIESTLFSTHHQSSFAAAAAAAAAMAEGLERRDPTMLRTMRNIRGRQLEYSNDFLRTMGIDVSTDAPYQAVVRRMNAKMDQLDRELRAMGL